MEGGRLERPPSDRALIVSIHDVAPSTARDVAWLLARLGELGIDRRVLKVIPNEGGERRLDADLDLVAALRAEQAAGGEIVLHGWTHQAASAVPSAGRRDGPSALDRLRARLFAGDAAEFVDLPATEAARRIEAGRDLLASLGLAVEGFCAPGWLAGRGSAAVLRAAGFRFLVSYGWLIDLARGGRHLLPGFGSMGTDDVQELLVGAEGGFVLLAAPLLPVIRVFLHPHGAPTSRACARTLRAIGRLRSTRTVSTFGDLLRVPA
jgi:predicted deacetylase